MNKRELIDTIAADSDGSKADVERVVDGVLEHLATALEKGDSVTLAGFGTFEVRERSARTGRNPQTGAEIAIAASKAPAFKASSTLKKRVNG